MSRILHTGIITAMTGESKRLKAVRSFVRRAGRVTGAQQRALKDLWPKFGIAYAPGPLDLDSAFGRRAPRIMEIGFGDGQLLTEMAERCQDVDYLGVEVHEAGVGRCLMTLDSKKLGNVRLLRHDAVEVLGLQIPDGSLAGVNLFFPDPWPKKRHHKRRIVQPAFVELLARKLCPGGVFRAATDWTNYAEHIDETVSANPDFEPAGSEPVDRLVTKFEQRGKRLGHPIWERAYCRVGSIQGAGNTL